MSKMNTPLRHCCQIDCKKAATYTVTQGSGVDDYTEVCEDHLGWAGGMAEDGFIPVVSSLDGSIELVRLRAFVNNVIAIVGTWQDIEGIPHDHAKILIDAAREALGNSDPSPISDHVVTPCFEPNYPLNKMPKIDLDPHFRALKANGTTTYRKVRVRQVPKGFVADHWGKNKQRIHSTLEEAFVAIDAVCEQFKGWD